MYATKEQDHQKRRDQEGSYSLYNYLYHYLLDNFEPEQLEDTNHTASPENLLIKEGIAYNRKGGKQMSEAEVRQQAQQAISNFCRNKGKHGDTAHNFGKKQENSVKNIVNTIQDLRW